MDLDNLLTLKEYNKKFQIQQENIEEDSLKDSTEQTQATEQHQSTHEMTKEAHKQALDIRKFEIEMYWKRATYFWTIIGVIFAGYFLLMKDDFASNHPTLILLLNCIGFIFSLSWYLVNRGSKFWQNNWEKHVDLLEDGVTGPLYKTVIQNGNLNFWDLNKEFSYSVSKINQLLSLFVTIIWFAMGIYLIFNQMAFNWGFIHSKWFLAFKIFALVLATTTAAFYLVVHGKSEVAKDTTEKDLVIKIRKIKEDKNTNASEL
jgi:hypothetical protein